MPLCFLAHGCKLKMHTLLQMDCLLFIFKETTIDTKRITLFDKLSAVKLYFSVQSPLIAIHFHHLWTRACIAKEFFLFVVPGMMPCFSFRKTTTTTTHPCIIYCWPVAAQSQGCFNLILPLLLQGTEKSQGARRVQNQDNGPKLVRNIFNIIWHHAKKKKKIAEN